MVWLVLHQQGENTDIVAGFREFKDADKLGSLVQNSRIVGVEIDSCFEHIKRGYELSMVKFTKEGQARFS